MASWQHTLEHYQQRMFSGELPRHFRPTTNHCETGCRVFCHGSGFLVLHPDLERVRCSTPQKVERTLRRWCIPAQEGWI